MENVNIEEYLCNVVSAEMPASFETEALKAQAIVARTYTMFKLNNKKNMIMQIYVTIRHVVRHGYLKKIDWQNGKNPKEMNIGKRFVQWCSRLKVR